MMKRLMANLYRAQMRKNKRMKKTDTTEDPMFVFESNRKSILDAKSRAKK